VKGDGEGFVPPVWAREGVPVSAAKGWGLDELRSRMETELVASFRTTAG